MPGLGQGENDEWWYERGPHGIGELNEAGRELLSFLSTNEATVCYTWFEKRPARKATWQHPGTKQWHCIDFIIMRQSQRRRCQNIDVMRGAECHTDHKMFRARVVCGLPKSFRKLPVERPPGRFDVLCLKGNCVDEQGKMTAKGFFVNGVSRRLQAAWNQEGSVEEKWTLLKTALTDTAQSTLGTQKRRSPDWFADNSSKLLPLY